MPLADPGRKKVRYYYLDADGQTVLGPHAKSEMRNIWVSRKLPGSTLCVREGSEDWQPLDQLVDELYAPDAKDQANVSLAHQEHVAPASSPSVGPAWLQQAEERSRKASSPAAGQSRLARAADPWRPTDYFLRLNGQQAGPYTISQLRLMIRTGQVVADTPYWADGLTEWLPLSALSDELDRPDSLRKLVSPPAFVPESHCSRGVYIILGLFFGFLGIHNFYAGRMKEAVTELLAFILLFWTIIVPLVIGVWVIFELCTVTTDGKGRMLK